MKQYFAIIEKMNNLHFENNDKIVFLKVSYTKAIEMNIISK